MNTHSLRLVALLSFAAVGCPSAPTPDAGDAATDAIAADTPDVVPRASVVRFTLPAAGLPPPFDVPFPSDLYRTDPDGSIVDTLADWSRGGIPIGGATFAEGFGALDGFGLTAGAVFLLDGDTLALDPTSLPADSDASLRDSAAIALIDLDGSTAPADARVRCVAGYSARPRALVIQPDGAALRPGRRYAAVVTDGVRTADGRSLVAAPTFAAIRDGDTAARATPAGQLYGPALERVVAVTGLAASRVVGLAVFTTQTTPRQLRTLRDDLRAGRYGAAPQLNVDPATAQPHHVVRFGAGAHAGWTATLDDLLGTARRDALGRDLAGLPSSAEDPTNQVGFPHDALGAIVSGTFTAPEFRTAFTDSPARGDGTMAFDAAGHAVARIPAQQIPVLIALPRSPMPARGYPMVIFGHGGGQDRGYIVAIANELARAGFGSAAIDLPFHGSRGQGFTADVMSNSRRGSYAGPDGLADVTDPLATVRYLGSLANYLAARDALRQTAIEVVQLYRLLSNPTLDLAFLADEYAGTAPRIDTAHIGYFGLSAGGIAGTLVASIEPDIDPYVLTVPCAPFFTTGVADSPGIGLQLAPALNTLFRVTSSDLHRFSPFLNLVQALFDGADPGSVAGDSAHPAIAPTQNVYMLFGEGDEAATGRCGSLLPRALGLTQVGTTPSAMPRAFPGTAYSAAPLRGTAGAGTHGVVLVQPGGHGASFFRQDVVNYEPPFPRDGAMRFVRVATPYSVRQPVVYLQRSFAHFFQTALTGPPEIDLAGLAPVPDADDDGWCDLDEAAAGTAFDPARHPTGTPSCPRDVGF